ncbi:MAG: ribbon-helix-helix domain-containing protein [Chloroflexi bacterium]|nr:ribbon-helix-helix domain-containing protein [Chloroflexota bacterium]
MAQKKVTLSLDANLIEDVQQLVGAGEAKSQSAFVEEALRARLKQLEREAWERSLEAASKDPMYLADMEEVERDFMYADAEAARMID